MKMIAKCPLYVVATSAIVILAGLLADSLGASPKYWDPAANGSHSGNGTWDTSTSDWATSGVPTPASTTWNTGDAANFDGTGGGTVTVTSGGISVDSLVFSQSGFTVTGGPITITGAGAINVTTGTATVNSTISVGTSNIESEITAAAGATLNLGGGYLAPNNEFGSDQLHFDGSGTFNLTGGLFRAGYITAQKGTGTVNQSGGTVLAGYQVKIGSNGSSTYNLSGSGTLQTRFDNVFVGFGVGGSGILNMTGGLLNPGSFQGTAANGGHLIIAYNGGTGTFNLIGGTVITGSGGATGATTNTSVYLTDGVNGETAVATISGGNLTTNGIIFGSSSPGSGFGSAIGTAGANAVSGNIGILNVAGGTVYVGAGGINLAAYSPATSHVNLSGGTIAATDAWASTMNMRLGPSESYVNGTGIVTGGTISGNVNFQTADSAATAHNITLNGAISGGSGFGLTASGGGTLTLGGINTYAGNTTVNSGASLLLADNAGLKFYIGTTGVNNQINGSGTLTLAGDFTFDLSGAGNGVGDTWNIVDNANLAETYSATFTVNGFTNAGGGLWTANANSVTYEFSEATGALLVVPEPSSAMLLLVASVGFFGSSRKRFIARKAARLA